VPHTFWIHKRERDQAVVMHYKEFSADPVWLPSVEGVEPKVSNLEGMEIFNPLHPPPDPAETAPREVSY
jgi:hypothetical protein